MNRLALGRKFSHCAPRPENSGSISTLSNCSNYPPPPGPSTSNPQAAGVHYYLRLLADCWSGFRKKRLRLKTESLRLKTAFSGCPDY